MMKNLLYLIVFLETSLLSFILVPIVMRIALKFDIVDKPGHRKVHKVVKPLMGGVAIFSSFFIVIVGNLFGFHLLQNTPWIQETFPGLVQIFPLVYFVLPKLALILGGGFLIHMVGLVDDIFKNKLTYKSKFTAQFIIILLVALCGIRTEFMPGKSLDIIMTTLWIVGITNSFNLLDNLDGLTSGVAIISSAIFFILAVLQGQIFFAFMLAALAGACLGFLYYNFHPSKLFMGDSGSLFLGYIFGTLTVTGSYVVPDSASLIPVVVPILILSIPLYDTFSVMFIRWREGRPLFVGDKRHFSHRLLDLGMSHRSTVVFIYLVSFCVGIVAVLLPYLSVEASFLVLLQAVTIYTLLTTLIIVGRQNK